MKWKENKIETSHKYVDAGNRIIFFVDPMMLCNLELDIGIREFSYRPPFRKIGQNPDRCL